MLSLLHPLLPNTRIRRSPSPPAPASRTFSILARRDRLPVSVARRDAPHQLSLTSSLRDLSLVAVHGDPFEIGGYPAFSADDRRRIR